MMLKQKQLTLGNSTTNMNVAELKLEWKDKYVLIVGAGLTGLSCAKFLRSNQIDFKLVDSRSKINNIPSDFEIELGNYNELNFSKADVLLVSPGVSVKHPLIKKAIVSGKEVIGDVELFCRLATKPIIAITGSNGKSTVTTLVNEIIVNNGMSSKLGGNIGIPCLDLLHEEDTTDCFVLELSSFQLETTDSLKSKASIILNLSEDHMDRYASHQEYFLAKKKILSNAENIIVNLDDDKVVEFCLDYKVDKITISLSNKKADYYIDVKNNVENVYYRNEIVFNLSGIKLAGDHNKLNILAALALTSTIGIKPENSLDVVNEFSGLPHRSEEVSQFNQLQWINDSKATNIGATIAALKGFRKKTIHLILGGQSKDQDFSEINPALSENIKNIFLYGEDAEMIFYAIESHSNTKMTVMQNMYDCVKTVNSIAVEGDVVLFSPACASFDQFDNYMMRGQAFIDAIARLDS